MNPVEARDASTSAAWLPACREVGSGLSLIENWESVTILTVVWGTMLVLLCVGLLG